MGRTSRFVVIGQPNTHVDVLLDDNGRPPERLCTSDGEVVLVLRGGAYELVSDEQSGVAEIRFDSTLPRT